MCISASIAGKIHSFEIAKGREFSDAPMIHSAGGNDAARIFGPLRILLDLRWRIARGAVLP